MTTLPINLTGAKPLVEREAAPNRNELRDAAQQFEAILLRQMLASARSTDFGGNDLFGGEGEDTFREMRDSQFAELTARSGQLGFAEAIENQLSRFLPQGDL
ncbi:MULTISPECIES: rod-binding protein [unclassified Erythrobacter]|uniref:rod-binding protein n=1 Tax=unclassified Erythrobacter TaxID=2633097 RepID=UPI0009FA93CA|nr:MULTISPECIES: rod-binding protein [unclassified Erythrobacter]MBO6527406.1 rod-binding protein [Erythrobacter sp.]MBO6530790.1 rod-binding protein [Erythrobacter sp.]